MDTLLTTILILIVMFALIAWDIYVAFFNDIPNSKDTISGQLRSAGSKIVLFPLAWGVLGGHFWGPSWEGLPVWWLPIIGVVLTLSHFGLRRVVTVPSWSALLYVIAGIPLGAVFWPQ